MPKTINSRDFNQNVGVAKKLADESPVVITDRGEPAYVLMKHDDYLRLTEKAPSILDLLADQAGEDIEFEPRRIKPGRIRRVDLD